MSASGNVLQRAARCHHKPCRALLRKRLFQPRDVLQETLAGQNEEVIAELRVLEVDLEQPVIGDRQHVAVFETFDGRGAPVVGRQESQFAHQVSGGQLDADLLD